MEEKKLHIIILLQNKQDEHTMEKIQQTCHVEKLRKFWNISSNTMYYNIINIDYTVIM